MSQLRQQRRSVSVNYSASEYGKTFHIPLLDAKLTSWQTFSLSAAATEYGTNRSNFIPSGTTSVSYTPLLHSTDTILSNLDTAMMGHEGDKTAFNQSYIIRPDFYSVIEQLQLNVAFALNVSAWVDGTAALEYVQLQVSSYQSNAEPFQPPMTFIYRPVTAFTVLTANGTHLFIVRDVVNLPFKTMPGGAIILNFVVGTSGTSVNDTYQIGLVDSFPVIKTAGSKRFFGSEIIAHAMMLPEEATEPDKWTEWEMTGTGRSKFG